MTIERPDLGFATVDRLVGELTHEDGRFQHLLQDVVVDLQDLRQVFLIGHWQLVAGLDRVFHQAFGVAWLDGEDHAPEERLVGQLALRQLAGEVVLEGLVHLDAGPKLPDGKFRPCGHLEGRHLWPQQELLLLLGQLLKEREGASLLGRQVDVH